MSNGEAKHAAVGEIPRRRRILFWLLLILLNLSLLPALEVLVRVMGVQTSDDPYLQFGWVPSFFTELSIGGEPYFKVVNREVYRERNTTFSLKKGPNTFRIFCLGESASAGWPHPASEIYSIYLQQALERAYPGRRIEVINVSGHAYAAYRIRLIFNQVLQFDPDLLILYTGNNEFLEKRNYGIGKRWYDPLETLADKSVLFRVLRGSVAGRLLFPENTLKAMERQHKAFGDWSKIRQLPMETRRDPAQFKLVQEHYEFSLRSMVEAAQNRGLPVVLLTVPVNLRDWRPNVSFNSLEEPRVGEWEAHYRAGRAALLQGDPVSAIQSLRTAIALDPVHADSYFYLASALEVGGDPDEVYRNYSLARDFDYNPFRALSCFNDILRRIAERYGNVRLADTEWAFRAANAPHVPGFNLFLDYVHPSQEGNLVIAKTVFDVITRNHYIGDRPAITHFEFHSTVSPDGTFYRDATDYRMQRILLLLFVMMHQDESIVKQAQYLMNAPGALESLGEPQAKVVRESFAVFSKLIDLDNRELLGGTVSREEREDVLKRLEKVYRENWGGYQEFEHDAKRK
jgi:tetratricopeptide (TPR) repeat protein